MHKVSDLLVVVLKVFLAVLLSLQISELNVLFDLTAVCIQETLILLTISDLFLFLREIILVKVWFYLLRFRNWSII